ncbi:MAG: hypothetical protein L0H53_08975 [Candidatus Nitrosocosmicus sp.]|nr:hypothetical protein [Candidatus Nitrosocosmicus sp.]MDN5867967.1 hypothetical protein [Candidatus Nitrosocosmicus sp.]
MPNEVSRKFTEWFKKNYPQEYYFFHKIETNLDKLYSSKHLGLHDGEFAEISLNIRKLEGDRYHLAADPFTPIFLGSTCKTMMDEFSNNMEAIISDRVQKEFENRFDLKCPNCDIANLTDSKYCNGCGIEL